MSQIYGFTGIFSPNNWTKMFENTTNGGSVTFSTDGNSVTLVSDDNLNGNAIDTKICSVKFPSNGLVTFNYNYKTTDVDGPFFDPFGYSYGIDGEFNQLTDNNGPNEQSGSCSIKVNKGQEFCFVQKCTDETLGPGTTIISNFKVIYTSAEVYVISVDEVNDYYTSYLNENSPYVNIYSSNLLNTVFLEYLKEEIGNYIENIEA
jgi:hypothetical protein